MKHLTLFTCLFCILECWPQTYTVKRLDIGNGLSNNYVIDIAEDKNGYLWFATEEGLNKLEGTEFTTFYKTEKDETGITGNELNCLLDDPDETVLWIGTQRAGLNAFNYETNTFTVYRHDDNDPHSLATDDVTGIYPAKDGNLWITTYWKGVDYLDKQTGKFIHYTQETIPQLSGDHIWTALDDKKGNLYIGHSHEGLTILSLKTKQVENFRYNPQDPSSIPGNEVLSLFQDHAGGIWVGTNKGLALFNPEQKNFVRFGKLGNPLSNSIYDICQFNDKQLWIATEFGGIAILDLSQRFFPSSDPMKFISKGDDEYTLSSPSVRCIFQDSHDNIWAGVWGGGVNFLSNNTTLFNAYHYAKDLSEYNLTNPTASAVCVDPAGKLWIGTDGGGINIFDKGKRIATYTTKEANISANAVQTACCDSQGNLWFGFFRKGITYYDHTQQSFKQILPSDLGNIDIRSIFEDKNGIMWIGSSNGIYQIDRDTKKIIKHINIPENLVRGVIADAQGRIWVGTFGSGLFLYTAELKPIATFNTANGFASNTINFIYEDKKHQIWIATGDGLACFPPNSTSDYQLYQRADGLDNTHIHAITEDNSGNIWFSTNNNIICFKTDEGKFYNYNHKDNVPLASFITGSVGKDSKGNLYFGSTNGLCHFNPESVLAPQSTPHAVITKLTILTPLSSQENKGKTYPLTNRKAIELNYKENNFSISYCVPNYALADQVEYAYMLKGFSDSWYTSVDKNNIIFRNLPYGQYQLMLKTRIRNQEWSDEVSTFSIKVTPPFWLSWIAKLVYLVIGGIILWALLKAYKRKVNLEYLYKSEKWNHEQEQQLNNERLRFFTNVTHELRTPLTLIIGPLEDMLEGNTLTEKDKHRINVIRQSAIRLLDLVNQILEFRKTETQNKKLCVCRENIVALIYEIGLKYKELNQNPHVNIQIQTEAEEMLLYFDKEALTIILDNLISNALKYTDKGHVTISAQWVEEQGIRYFQLNVADTGYGISPEALKYIFDRYYQEGSEHQASGTGIGLALVKNLTVLHEGKIEVKSKLNEGTVFQLRLVAANTYPAALHRDNEKEGSQDTLSQSPAFNHGATDNTRLVILIVEDNKDILDYIADSFTDLYEVKTALNGKEGMEIALECIPDIIVSDIMMPVMDGITLCKQLKNDIRTSHIPIILLTAKDTLSDKEEGYQSGADSYLTKPFSASLLHSRINNLLAQRRRLFERYSSITVPQEQEKGLEEKHLILTNSLNKIDQEFLEKITHVITENLSSTETIDISFLSSHLCMSNSTLYRKVKALTGMSTNEYIRKIKMRFAEKMLLEGKYNISEIAFKVGINSTVYFRQCFKEEFGITPSEYLKKIKKG